MLEKAGTRLDAISADLANKNKLVDKVAELQRTTGEVRSESNQNGQTLRYTQLP